MAINVFLKIEGIEGESVDEEHAGEIDVLSWSWGMTQSGTTHAGGGGGAGKVNIQDLTITKLVDTATASLVLACCSGKHYEKAMLTVRKGGKNPKEYLTINLDTVLVTSLSTESESRPRVTETITLNFSKFELAYTPLKRGAGGGAPIKAGWDIEGNKQV